MEAFGAFASVIVFVFCIVLFVLGVLMPIFVYSISKNTSRILHANKKMYELLEEILDAQKLQITHKNFDD